MNKPNKPLPVRTICPKCRQSIPLSADQPLIRCPRCQFSIDRLKIGTNPSFALAPLLRDLSGEKIGDYRIGELAGIGSTGMTYKARHKAGGGPVIVKILAYDPVCKSEFAGSFSTVMTALASLKHPHIVRVNDFGRQDDLFYLVTEYVEGVDLGHYLKSFRLEGKEAVGIMKKIAAAVSHAHGMGIQHRNLKPSNIIMGKGIVKVTDFGISHLAIGDYRRPLAANMASVSSGYIYMAPEMKRHPDAAGKPADVYSLSAVFYELLTGSPPEGLPRKPSSIVKKLPESYDQLIESGLSSNPGQRPADAPLFQDALEHPKRIKKTRKPARVRASLVAALLLAILGFLITRPPVLQELRNSLNLLQPIRNRIQTTIQSPDIPPTVPGGKLPGLIAPGGHKNNPAPKPRQKTE